MLTEQWTVPELGPSLGSLTDPPSPGRRSPLGLTFDDIRLDLVTGIFDLAGAARGFAAAGDRDGAMASLGRVAWIGLWERAVGSVAARLGGAANTKLRAAAAESRFPERRLQRMLLGPSDLRAIGARLGSSGAPFVSALDALERSLRSASGTPARAGSSTDEWRAALRQEHDDSRQRGWLWSLPPVWKRSIGAARQNESGRGGGHVGRYG